MILNWKATKFLGDNSAHLLDPESTKTLIKTLESKFNINVNVGFKTPGFKYFKMLKDTDFDMLRQYPHQVTVSYGIHPIWCLWLTTINSIHYNLYVNFVTSQIIWSRHRFSSALYNDTILEGEIIQNHFVIWDILVHKGICIANSASSTNQNHFRRQDIIRSILDHQYVADPVIENIKLINREYVTYQHIKSYLKKVTSDPPPYVPANMKPVALSFIPVGKSVKIYNLLLSERNSNIQRIDSTLNKLEYPIDYHPINIKTGKMVHPSKLATGNSNDSQLYQNFWISPVEGYVDNYWQYVEDDSNPNLLVKVGLIITQTKESSLRVRDTFDTVPITHIKSGIRGLLKWKCQYVPRFQKWEPIELIG